MILAGFLWAKKMVTILYCSICKPVKRYSLNHLKVCNMKLWSLYFFYDAWYQNNNFDQEKDWKDFHSYRLRDKFSCCFWIFLWMYSKSRKQFMVSSILPKNERWDNFMYWKLSQHSLFGRIQDATIYFPDLETFSHTKQVHNNFG